MKREDDQQLWDLLGEARPTEVSPFFARSVIRAVRLRSQRFDWLGGWLSPTKVIPATVLAAAVVAALMLTHRPVSPNPADRTPDVIVAIDPQDYDVVADLDELMAADDNNLWDDDTQTL